MKSDEHISRLPQPIVDRLREIISRVRRLQWVRGSLLTAAAAVASLLCVMAADAAFSLEWVPLRLAVSLGALGVTAWVAWHHWMRPLMRRITLTGVARWLESRHPELQERISTAVELMDPRHGSQDDAGSRELLEEVVRAAVADTAKLDPAEHLGPQRSRGAKRFALAAGGGLMAVIAVWPHQAPLLLVRAVAPLADVGNAWANSIRVITKSQVVASGEPLALEAAVSGKTGRVELRMTDSKGGTLVEVLNPDSAVAVTEGETGYALRLPEVKENFTARVVSGKAVSAAFSITVVPRPETRAFAVTYHFPDYMKREDETRTNASGEIAAFAGTKVTVSAPLNRPVAKAEVFIGENAVPDLTLGTAPDHSPTLTWSAVLLPGLETHWHSALTDADGITSRAVRLPVRSLPDRAPLVKLESPADEEMELRPTERLPMTYTATEDVGFSAVRMRIRAQGKPDVFLPAAALPELDAGSTGTWHGEAVLDLRQVPVPDGGEFRVALVVEDNLPPGLKGPQQGESREILIRMRRGARSLTEQVFAAQHQELRERMDHVRNELQDARGRLNDKPDRLRHDDKLSENVLKDLESTTQHLEEAQKQMEALTERMKNTAFAKQTPDLARIAQHMMKPAANHTKEIPLTDKQETRANLAQAAKDQLEQALQKLEEQQRELDKKKEDVRKLAQLADIAEEQKALARQAGASLQPAETEADPAAAAAELADASKSATVPPPAAGAALPPEPDARQAARTQTQQPQQQPQAAAAEQAQTQTQSTANADAAKAAEPTPEEQRQWLEAQRKVADRAKQLMDENRNRNPEGRQQELRKAGVEAASLAATAKSLAKKQEELEARIAAAGTAQAKTEAAAAQQALTQEARALEQKTFEFQIQASHQIEQSAATQEAAYGVQNSLGQAVKQAQASSEALAKAAEEAAKPQTGDPAAGEPTHSEAKDSGSSGQQQQAAASGTNAAQTVEPGKPGGQSATASAQPETAGADKSPNSPAPSGMTAATKNKPAPAEDDEAGEEAKAAPGHSAAAATKEALQSAASSFENLDLQLQALAGVIGAHGESLNEGTKQAGQAAEQAGQPAQQGQQPSMRQGAAAARLAAEKLIAAAATAMQAAGVPKNANTPQTAGQRSEAKGSNGRPNESGQPGKDGGDILQADSATGAMPAELAKLGLTPGEWAKLKGVLGGVDSASSDQIPPEYRELVKAYFGALSKGGGSAAKPEPSK